MSGKSQHVVPHQDGWAWKGAGNGWATTVQPTQQQVLSVARSIVKNQKSEVVIHGRNGQIRAKDSYGRDFFPPKG